MDPQTSDVGLQVDGSPSTPTESVTSATQSPTTVTGPAPFGSIVASQASTISAGTSSGVIDSSSSATTQSPTNEAGNAPASTPISPTAPGESQSGTNAGVVAGAAVGAAVGAAILTFIITYMLLRRKNPKRRQKGHRSSSLGGFTSYSEKALPKDPSQREDAMIVAPAWQKHIPQSADDQTIRSSVKTLFDQVEVHVENFYRDSVVSLTEEQQAEVLRVDSPHLPESIVALLPRVRSQTALIKHCLLSYIVASISTDDHSVQSLLPVDYATLSHLARATKQKKPAFDQAFSQWRVLSAYLRPSPKSDADYLSRRDASVNAAAIAFCNAFAPWANPAYSESTRRQNVAEIFKSAAEVGILIFSQPSTFTYQWNPTAQDHRSGGGGAAGVIVVTPALLKVADENAVALEKPQVMIQMATLSI